jgi:type III secretory pathway component EscR
MKTPNPEWHFKISIVKSLLRIIAGIALLKSNMVGAGLMLILAEVLGIAEEIV